MTYISNLSTQSMGITTRNRNLHLFSLNLSGNKVVFYYINLSKPTGHVMHQEFNLLKPTDYVMHQQFNILKLIGYVIHQQVNLLKPPGHVMHQLFIIQQLTLCPHCIYVFCIYLRSNSDLCHLQHKLIGFYNRDEKCLLSGTNWVFK